MPNSTEKSGGNSSALHLGLSIFCMIVGALLWLTGVGLQVESVGSSGVVISRNNSGGSGLTDPNVLILMGTVFICLAIAFTHLTGQVKAVLGFLVLGAMLILLPFGGTSVFAKLMLPPTPTPIPGSTSTPTPDTLVVEGFRSQESPTPTLPPNAGEGPDVTPTAHPTEVPTPHPTEVPTPHTEKERFVVVAIQGVWLRSTPNRSSANNIIGTDTLPAGTELAITGDPIMNSEGLRWWPVSVSGKTRYVAEWQPTPDKRRLLKPVIRTGDTVFVYKPVNTKEAKLYDDACNELQQLPRGTELQVLSEPVLKVECEAHTSEMARQGRRWIHVRTPDGGEGWVADFESQEKAIVVAPQWYIDRSKRTR